MARETTRENQRATSVLGRRSYLKLAGMALATTGAAAAVGDTATAATDIDDENVATADEQTFSKTTANGEPEITTFTISKSKHGGSDRLFRVMWAATDGKRDLETVKVTTAENGSAMNSNLTPVSGGSAAGWEIFQSPAGTTLDVDVQLTDATGMVTTETQTVAL